MKLILRADVDNLGRLGQVVKVKPGYGRNYLIPQGLAMMATAANLKSFEVERKKLQAKMDAVKAEAQSLADKLAAAEVLIRVRTGEADRLYGSVTASTIVDALAEMGIEMDKRKIDLDDPIRSLGEYSIRAKLHPDVRSEITVRVVKHDWVPGQETAEGQEQAEAPEASGTNDAGQAEQEETA
ncbi:MAG: 50S ribosomal protein L9 [Thermodesulfobacteriota bacterium]